MTARRLYDFGPFRLDPAERRLTRDGEPVAITPKCFDLLVALVESSGHLLEKEELLGRVWPNQFVEESNLSFNISALRKVLGEGYCGQRYIETVPKKGFRFVARVEECPGDEKNLTSEAWGGESPPGHGKEGREGLAERGAGTWGNVPAALPPAVSRRSPASRIFFVTVAAGVLGLFAYGLWARRAAMPSERPLRTIAVLPFKPLSAASRDESLEMGMAETLITRLGGIRHIVVRPMSAVRKYSDPSQDPVKAGRELQAEAVLDGSIQKAGERVRVTVRLTNTQTGTALWAEQFDTDFTDIFKVQDSISERVMRALTLRLSGEEREKLTKRYTDNPEAYQLYLQGHYLWTKRGAEDLRNSFAYYQQAIEKDPNFALAYVGLAESHMSLMGAAKAPVREAFPKAMAGMAKALELDPTLAEARNALAEIKYQYEYDWPGAEREFKQAIELNPNAAFIHLAYGWFLMSAGRFDEAQVEMEKAQELDPSSIIINRARGRLFHYMRQYDRAVEHFRKILEVEPNVGVTHWSLAMAYEQKGMYAEAAEEYFIAGTLEGQNRPEKIGEWREVLRTAGWQGLVQRRVIETEKALEKEYISPTIVANTYVRAGQRDRAFAWLEKALEERDPNLVRLKIEPLYDGLRSDPRYTKLLQRINLTP